MIDSASFGRIRRRLASKLLPPVGFDSHRTPVGTAYSRVVGTQIHYIDFQASNYGGEFTVNLGFHDTLAPSPKVDTLLPVDVDKMNITDCILTTRLGIVLHGVDKWLPYGDDCNECEGILSEAIAAATDELNAAASDWSTAAAFLRFASPDFIRAVAGQAEDNDVFDEDYQASEKFDWGWLRRWRPQWVNFVFFLCSMAMRQGNLDLATAYCNAGLNLTPSDLWKRRMRKLICQTPLRPDRIRKTQSKRRPAD